MQLFYLIHKLLPVLQAKFLATLSNPRQEQTFRTRSRQAFTRTSARLAVL
ncbi:hypothetical protein EV13_1440 [Prochlorococcus sp. MIT 0702]|nr:hypothetical protein EV12_1362 [Prochlorococcus sp. MIT 0701]KGG28926.1 hypothetical protein EV13_1440 [Prochlorococcus sp. MIT 0702]KGG37142.1 hypothetical protein EV14_0084 [Prochlorococcus sp. MIT 0703]